MTLTHGGGQIGLVDYGAGNLRSVAGALERIGACWRFVGVPGDLDGVSGVILPGVGRMGPAALTLERTGLGEALTAFADTGRPLLGICLGMQILFDGSEEDPETPGLGLLPGRVRRLDSPRSPHIGWSLVRTNGADPLFAGLPAFHAWFAHSFALPDDSPFVTAGGDAPPRFAAAARRGNVRGLQFHPEKSGETGVLLLARFASLCGALRPWEEMAGNAAETGGNGEGFRRGRARRGAWDPGGFLLVPVGPADLPGAAERTGSDAGPAPVASPLPPRPRRIIPCLDVADGRVVKGVRFRDLRDAGDPVERAAAYDRDGADELCFLDVSASREDRRPLVDLVRRVADQLSVPFTVGGGIRTVEEMRDLLLAGADRVSLSTAAIEDPSLVSRAAERFGRQFVVVSVDARRGSRGWEVTIRGGSRATGRDAVEWARTAEELGAGEILLNAMDADGTRGGYDVELTQRVAQAVRIPVIASGGAGGAADIASVLAPGGADAALAASIFHDGSVTVRGVKEELQRAGIEVRL